MEKELEDHFEKGRHSSKITPHADFNKYSDPVYEIYDGTHTTHVTVMGPNGQAVACTS